MLKPKSVIPKVAGVVLLGLLALILIVPALLCLACVNAFERFIVDTINRWSADINATLAIRRVSAKAQEGPATARSANVEGGA